jgi:hypothetical protein
VERVEKEGKEVKEKRKRGREPNAETQRALRREEEVPVTCKEA